MYDKRVTARCPASCGELIQGLIRGREMLVSYPVNLYSYVSLTIGKKTGNTTVYPKIRKALEVFLGKYRIGINIDSIGIEVESTIPIGKGMASSTADIAAALCAASGLLDVSLSEAEAAELAVSVEPTDSTIFAGLTLFDHLQGQYRELLGEVPAFRILAVEGKGVVDTVAFRRDPGYITRVRPRDNAYELLLNGIEASDLNMIGQAAMESSILNQELLNKPYLESLIDISMKYGAAGVNVAHSGTVCGIICSGGADVELLKHRLELGLGTYFTGFHYLTAVRGGAEII